MANTESRPLDRPKIIVYGIQKNADGSFTTRDGVELTSVPTVSGHTVTNPGTYRFMDYAVIEMTLGDYPTGFSLVDYSSQFNANDSGGAYSVGMKQGSAAGECNILFRLDGKTPAPNFGNVYFTYFILIKPSFVNSGATPDEHYETYTIDNDVEIVACSFYGGQVSTENRIKIALI